LQGAGGGPEGTGEFVSKFGNHSMSVDTGNAWNNILLSVKKDFSGLTGSHYFKTLFKLINWQPMGYYSGYIQS
jgi:hypothetical protein